MELLYGAGILIVAVLLWRALQWFREYQRKLRIRLEPVPPGPGGDDVTSYPELGKVKVRPRITAVGVGEQDEPAPRLAPAPRLVANDPPPRPARTEATIPETPAPARPEAVVEAPATEESVPVLLTPVAESVHEVQRDMFAHEPIPPRPFPRREAQPLTPAQVLYDKPVEPVRPVRSEPEVKPHVDVQDVIAVHVVCRGDPFNGEDLLRCILSYGLRFGEMSIFHRHERPTGQGRILFSMAKAVEPGIFDLEAMTGEEVPGVSFFLSLPGVNSIHAFDIMVDTAKRLATELQGEILDEQQQPLTRQLVEHYRERVQEFERRRLMQRPAH